ncbi:MAG TPA: hypothetical protein VFO65_08040, partial [Acidimicrobiales bacterium]|nr:hypothetical protein [Acidimicrobiales bacterium]
MTPVSGGAEPSAWAAPRQPALRRALVAADVVAVAAAWYVVLEPLGGYEGATAAGLVASLCVVTIGALALMASQQLYLARVCRVRPVELSRLLRVSVVVGVLAQVAGPRLDIDLSATLAGVAVVTMLAALATARGGYSVWLRRRRSRGHSTRPVV